MLFLITLMSLAMSALIFIRRFRAWPIYFLICFYFFIDYANYSFDLNESILGTAAKSYKEMLLATSVIFALLQSFRKGKIDRSYALILLVSVALLIYGATVNGALQAALDWRDSALPIVIAFSLCASRIVDESLAYQILRFFSVLILLNCVLAIYQYVVFQGSPEEIWRYQFLLEENQKKDIDYHERFASYQVMRGGQLRSSGLFASALHFSYSAALASFYFYVKARSVSKTRYSSKKILFYSAMTVCVAGVYVSQVRAAIVILLLSILIHASCYSAHRHKEFRSRLALSIFLGGAALYFSSLVLLSSYLDSSVLGRIPQYFTAVEGFRVLGLGAGAVRGSFDSYYVYGVMTYGLVFMAWICYIFKAFHKLVKSPSPPLKRGSGSNLRAVALCSFYPALFIAIFQHFSGSLYYQLIWLIFAVCVFSRTLDRGCISRADIGERQHQEGHLKKADQN